jgi:sulfur-carrier protein
MGRPESGPSRLGIRSVRTAHGAIARPPHDDKTEGRMMVRVLLYGVMLRQAIDETELTCDLPQPATVKGLIEANGEKLAQVLSFAHRGELLITVNRKIATLDTSIRDEDVIKLTHQSHAAVDGARWHNP